MCVLCGSPVWPSPPVVGPLRGPPLCGSPVGGVLPCRVWHLFLVLPLARAHTLAVFYLESIYIHHISIYGLFLEGARFDGLAAQLDESEPKVFL